MDEEREFGFRDADFRRVKTLIHDRAGINLSDNKKQLVYSRLARRIRALRLNSFADYLDYLAQHDSEIEHFTNALTTNLTAFFREPHHFDILAREAPRLKPRSRRLKVWCAAASTGEEPYSIAISLAQAFGTLSPPVDILATDIDSRVLQQGETGVYGAERISNLNNELKQRFFWRGTGRNLGKVRVIPELRKLIRFERLNLLDATWSVGAPLDVIFCRNVMIYFDKPTQHRLLEKMVRLMVPEGLYFAGHSESFIHAKDVVRLVERSTYQPVRKR